MYMIGLTGVSGAGKTTFAEYLAVQGEFLHISFSLPLRALVYTVYKLDITRWADKAYEHTTLTEGPGRGATPQQLLIREGAAERAHDPWVFVRYVAQLMRDNLPTIHISAGVVFDDVRQANEALFIRNLGGTILELRRANIERAPQALDGNLHLLGGKVVHADCILLNPLNEARRTRPINSPSRYLDMVDPSPVLYSEAEKLMRWEFQRLNQHLL